MTLEWIIVICIVVLILYLVFSPKKDNQIRKRKIRVRIEEPDYQELDGHQDPHAPVVEEKLLQDPEPDRLNRYRLGEINLFHLNLPNQAIQYYEEALGDQFNEPVDQFIVDRIMDTAVILQDAELFRIAEEKQRSAVRTTNWTSDSQNVHDSAISDNLIEQYKRIKQHSGGQQTMDDIYKYIAEHQHEIKNINKVNNALFMMNRGTNPPGFGGDTETDILEQIWNRIHSPENKNNIEQLKVSLFEQIADCDGVCLTGRVSRVISSLAYLDHDKEIGILKNKQILRNELMEELGKILNKNISQLDKEDQEKYHQNTSENEKIKEMKEQTKKEMQALTESEQFNKLPIEQRNQILKESIEQI